MNRGFAGSGTYIEKGHRLAGGQVFPLYSGKMTASCATRTFPRCHKSPFSSWSFVGILLVVQVLLLPTSSGRGLESLLSGDELEWVLEQAGGAKGGRGWGELCLVGQIGGARPWRAKCRGVGVKA